jgi:hypothetical protein
MRFLSWLSGLKPDSPRRGKKRRDARRSHVKPRGTTLSLEALEDRRLLTFTRPSRTRSAPTRRPW